MKLRLPLVGLLSCTLIIGCTKFEAKDDKSSKNVSVSEITEDKTLSPKDKAEKLALAAEQMISPLSFMYADTVAREALKNDSTNQRAKYVIAMVGPMMSLKGIMKRIEPMASRNAESAAKYQDSLAQLEAKPNHALKTFLLDGQADIKTEEDVQSVLDGFRKSFTQLRTFFKSNKNSELTINLPEMATVAAMGSDDQENCYWEDDGNGNYNEFCENYDSQEEPQLQYKLASADMEVIQHMVAAYEIYMILINSYSASGVIKVSEDKSNENASSKEILAKLFADKKFATLRNKAAMNSIITMGLDAVAGARLLNNAQQSLCTVRKGYLFADGICIDQDPSEEPVENALKAIEMILTGSTYAVNFSGINGQKTAVVRPVSFLEGQLQDVRDLGLEFSECGKVTSAKDSSLAGIFPNKDANAVIALGQKQCWE